jgi:UDP-glucose:tetrahydrobiopterin glucosyltransferase
VKIAIVAPLVSAIRQPQRGGSQAFVAELARGLGERGYDVHLYAASGSEVAGVEVIDTGVDPRALEETLYRAAAPREVHAAAAQRGATAAAAAFTKLYGAVRNARYDVVHNHAFDAPAIRLATDLGAPVVHTLHLPPEAEIADAVRTVFEPGQSPTIACVSAFHAGVWRRIVPAPAVLPPYVPTSTIPFSPAAGDGAVFAGRLSPEKGAAEAIEIAAVAGVPIDVFGDSYDPEYVRNRIHPVRSAPGVVVHPGLPQRALWDAIARAAVVLCPSKWDEPFGMVAAEAQACGTPVVAFRRGALDEVIIDGVTGFLVAPDDVAAAADAVRLAPALARADCRQHAESRLDLELSLDAHTRLYQRLVSARRAGPRRDGRPRQPSTPAGG